MKRILTEKANIISRYVNSDFKVISVGEKSVIILYQHQEGEYGFLAAYRVVDKLSYTDNQNVFDYIDKKFHFKHYWKGRKVKYDNFEENEIIAEKAIKLIDDCDDDFYFSAKEDINEISAK
jgi:hypothetical protein